MPRTNYQKGREFEYRTRDRLYDLGAEYVMRAASSKGVADLIALFPSTPATGIILNMGQVWLIQCKTNGKLPRLEREEIRRVSAITGHRAIMACKNKRGNLILIELGVTHKHDIILEGA